jgi:hypothetical protein
MKKARTSWKSRDEDDEEEEGEQEEWDEDGSKKRPVKQADDEKRVVAKKRPREDPQVADMKRRLEIDMNLEFEEKVHALKKQMQEKMDKKLSRAMKKKSMDVPVKKTATPDTMRCKHCKREMNPRSFVKHSETCFGLTSGNFASDHWSCLVCGAKISKANFKRHWNKVHVNKDIERLSSNGAYVCPFFNCGHTTLDSDELYAEHIMDFHGKHERTTDGSLRARRIQCIKCDLSVGTQSDLW